MTLKLRQVNEYNTIQEILEEKKRIDIRSMFEVLKSAEKQRETQGTQISLEL